MAMRAMWNGTVPSGRGERIGFLRRLLGGAEAGAERS